MRKRALAAVLALGLALTGITEGLSASGLALGCLALAALTALFPAGKDK